MRIRSSIAGALLFALVPASSWSGQAQIDLNPYLKKADAAATYATPAQVAAVPVYTDAQAKAAAATLTTFATAAQLATMQASMPTPAQMQAAAPVQMVNNQTGNVTIPAFLRQYSTPLTPSATTGLVTWTFPTAFASTPTCGHELSAAAGTAAANDAFDDPVVTTKTLQSVTFKVTAHPSVLSLISTPLIIPAPAGTSIVIWCWAPM